MEIENLAHRRHSLAHLLASAVLKLYPEAKPTLGPAIDTGFYYDFDLGEIKLSDKDLGKIEKEMKKMLPRWKNFESRTVTPQEAREIYKSNPYKLELIDEIENKGEQITLYTCSDFTDLCRGGHTENPAEEISPDSFRLQKVAGAYWRGDEKNQMLTRIYGLAFEDKETLENYEKQLAEASLRDHRKIGKELGLFTFSDLVGAGLPLFTQKGTAMREAIVDKISEIQEKYGYQRVWIPHITKPDLYKKSGHWEKFGDELFKVQGRESEFVMKPMNCPHHTQIYASSPKSYKDLPVRFAESTAVYRDEQTGELLGLSRVRAITQDDGHVFCTPEQIKQEIKNIVAVIKEFYSQLGMWNKNQYRVALSVRDPKEPQKYLGGDEVWNNAEKILEEIANEENLPFKKEEGEAAFYGPKLDFKFKDAIGREWQLATVQLDFNMPERFELEYTDKDGVKKTPVMIHRAIAGALERFMSVIIEHFAGNFPLWLSPVQIKIIPVRENHNEFATKIFEQIKSAGFRTEIDTSDENLGKKIRNAKTEKIPFVLVIGDKEIEQDMVTVESRDNGNLGQKSISDFIEEISK